MKVANWGNYPVIEADVTDAGPGFMVSQKIREQTIARGLGRCYGDASLSTHIVSSLKLNRFISFDRNRGILHCEAGVSFDDILQLIVPAGWFLPVTPGTKFITVGGAIAADVHGKNHHVDGSFCKHVQEITIMLANGEVVTTSPTHHPDLFNATAGGMGLTGIILAARFSLKHISSSYITQRSFKARNLEEIFHYFEEKEHFTYSVAWIDCLSSGKSLGRSVLHVGEHSELEELPADAKNNPLELHGPQKISVPIYLPSFTLNNLSVMAFNELYYANQKNKVPHIVHYNPFFYPLDNVGKWNRIYGKKGFVQYQFVLPKNSSREGLFNILNRVSSKGKASFLAVLKLFGKQDGLLSFPMEGYTLALDFPVSNDILQFLDELDTVVKDYGGRVYLAKDARMKPEIFAHTYTQLNKFKEIKRNWDPEGVFSSHLSERLGL